MGHSLFIDTSAQLVLGLLNEKFEWLEYYCESNYKNSSKLHSTIYELLDKNSLKITDISQLFRISGPGSYTGLRLTEGLGQIFDWREIETFAFNHFQVPQILGYKNGSWISKAFKKELFLFSWDEKGATNKLVPESDLVKIVSSTENLFTHFNGHLEGEYLESSSLIKEQSEKLFNYIVLNQINEPTFYYREVEDEFKPSLK